MGEHKGVLTIVLAVLLIFSVWIMFNNKYLAPAVDKTGQNVESMVDKTFDNINENNTPGLK